jgi:DNA-binding LacI/PurR family transcriptional regulator
VSALADVARLAGVSKSTASRALSGGGYVSEDTREKVSAAASSLGYVVSSAAASLVTGRTLNVGVIIPFINRWFFGEVLEGIESSLTGAGYDLTLYRVSDDPEQRRRVFDYFLVRKRVDAVIAVGIELTAQEILLLRSLGKPIVGLGGRIEGIPTLSIDDVEAARVATAHLLSLGHTRIMHLGGDQHEQLDFRVQAQRLSGFEQAMQDAGRSTADVRAVPFSIPGGYATALRILADPRTRPTAIVAGCDEIAIGVILAARQLGIQVPTQLSVIGIDDHYLAEMFALTTLSQAPEAQGRMAVDLLMNELRQPSRPESVERITVPVRLRVRSSTTAPARPV